MSNSKDYQRRWRAANRERLVAYKRIWNRNNRDAINAQRLVRYTTRRNLFLNNELNFKFGISLIQYNEMMKSQNGCCAICGTHQDKQKKRMSVDHDHDTGKVRSLLCNYCNTGLGYFRENIDTLNKAIKYLYEHNCTANQIT